MYRHEAPERVADQIAERVAEIAREVDALDSELGSWAKRIPDGAPAPPPVLVLMQRRERLMAELRNLADAASAVRAGVPGVVGRLFGWLRSR